MSANRMRHPATGLLIRALELEVVFALCQLFGLRQFTSMLSLTFHWSGVSRSTGIFLGILYLLTYLLATVVAPSMIIAAIIMRLFWRKTSA